MAIISSAYAAAYGYTALRQQVLEDEDLLEPEPKPPCIKVLNASDEGCQVVDCNDLSDLDQALLGGEQKQRRIQVILLHQYLSQDVTNASPEMIAHLLDQYQIMPEFLEVLSNFGYRKESTDEGYCSPLRARKTPESIELTYVYKYTEFKTKDDTPPWVIRQTAVWHRYSIVNNSSIAIVLSPNKDCLYRRQLVGLLGDTESRSQCISSPLLMHAKLISAYAHNWKNYLIHYENEIIKQSHLAMNADVMNSSTRPQNISPNLPLLPTLQRIHQIRRHLIPVDTILSSTELLCGQLRDLDLETRAPHPAGKAHGGVSMSVFTSFMLEAGAFRRNAGFLTRRASQVSQLISDTLNLRNQEMARKDSVTIRVITLITLFYLPFSFIATLLGSNLIDFDTDTRDVIVSNQFWLFFVISLPLTGLTILGWWFWITWGKRVEQVRGWRRAVSEWATNLRYPTRRGAKKNSLELSDLNTEASAAGDDCV